MFSSAKITKNFNLTKKRTFPEMISGALSFFAYLRSLLTEENIQNYKNTIFL